LIASKGDVSIFFASPISLTFLCLSVLSIVWSLKSNRNKIASPAKESNP
jgi:TctA family transporter